MEFNILYLFLAALIPLIIGSIWYNPKVMGTAWMKSTGLSEEELQGGNMPLIFGLCYLLSCFLAFAMAGSVIHQLGFYQLFVTHPDFGDASSDVGRLANEVLTNYADRHRSFGHGAVHGIINAITFALPFLGINALFERKSFKYIGIHLGYWIITLALMGGVLSTFY